MVVLGHCSLTLKHLDCNCWLVVTVGGEDLCLVGMVVFLLIKLVITPPAVSMPRERGATSSSKRSPTVSLSSPLRMAAWTAAPYATASSGLIDLFNSFPLKKS